LRVHRDHGALIANGADGSGSTGCAEKLPGGIHLERADRQIERGDDRRSALVAHAIARQKGRRPGRAGREAGDGELSSRVTGPGDRRDREVAAFETGRAAGILPAEEPLAHREEGLDREPSLPRLRGITVHRFAGPLPSRGRHLWREIVGTLRLALPDLEIIDPDRPGAALSPQ
jgi:hypothetical protein